MERRCSGDLQVAILYIINVAGGSPPLRKAVITQTRQPGICGGGTHLSAGGVLNAARSAGLKPGATRLGRSGCLTPPERCTVLAVQAFQLHSVVTEVGSSCALKYRKFC